MPSPFPGMNPYLEVAGHWRDFHATYLPELRRRLVPQLPPDYEVGVEEELFVHEASADERRLTAIADAAVSIERVGPWSEAGAARGVAAAAPAYATLPESLIVERHRWLEVRDRDYREAVTVIELLSPTNKNPSLHRDLYEAKRLRLVETGVNLVEIDLLRGHGRMPMDGAPPCDYCVVVSRRGEQPRVGVWPLALRDPLPTVPVPLRAPDADLSLDLQAALHRVYDDAGYARQIYRRAPDPPLPPADAAWAEALAAPEAQTLRT